MSNIFYPESIQAMQSFVLSHERIIIVGGQSKLPFEFASTSKKEGGDRESAILSTEKYAGIIEYDPSEFTITAKAGTKLELLDAALLAHGQYMPFDPPLIDQGATLGGAIAAGVSGPCRLRYGGIRDFVLGVRFVDGAGGLIAAGGKVVKNAAGFDIPKLMIGSWGRLGVLAEVTLKVFPRPIEQRSICLKTNALAQALDIVRQLSRTSIEMDGLDIDASNNVLVRVGGNADTVQATAERILALSPVQGRVIEPGKDEVQCWKPLLDWSWHREANVFARVPLTSNEIPAIHDSLQSHDAHCRFSVAGNVAWVDWPSSRPIAVLESILTAFKLRGRILRNRGNLPPAIGYLPANSFADRVSRVFDPHEKFV